MCNGRLIEEIVVVAKLSSEYPESPPPLCVVFLVKIDG